MESFSLLKYWRTTAATAAADTGVSSADSTVTTKTIIAAASISPDSSDNEDGPFFDLEFTLPDQETDTEEDSSVKRQENNDKETENEDESESGSENDDDDDDEEEELKFAISANDCTEQNVTLSPSDELFFKGDLVSIEPSSILLNNSDENSKLPIFLLKSATKFRVLLLKLKKSKSINGDNLEKKDEVSASPRVEKDNLGKVSSGNKFFAVKFKGEEAPLASLFTRDSSSKENNGKGVKQSVEDSDERKLTKEVVQKYLKMVKPFYIRVSKRYVDKLKFSGNLGGGPKCGGVSAPEKGAESNVKTQMKQGKNLQAGLKVVRKHLGKSRSASSAVAAAPPGKTTTKRVDDSLVQLQDGIQGAILHCKRSLNASTEVEESSSILSRSVSDPSYQKSAIMAKVSSTTPSRLGKAKETN